MSVTCLHACNSYAGNSEQVNSNSVKNPIYSECEYLYYIAIKGDYYHSIAEKCGCDINELLDENNTLRYENKGTTIYPGDFIKLPSTCSKMKRFQKIGETVPSNTVKPTPDDINTVKLTPDDLNEFLAGRVPLKFKKNNQLLTNINYFKIELSNRTTSKKTTFKVYLRANSNQRIDNRDDVYSITISPCDNKEYCEKPIYEARYQASQSPRIPETDEIENLPNETQKVPDETQKVPNETQKVPNEIENLPNETQKVPDETQKVPNETQKVPDEKNLPDNTQKCDDLVSSSISGKITSQDTNLDLKNASIKVLVPNVSAYEYKSIRDNTNVLFSVKSNEQGYYQIKQPLQTGFSYSMLIEADGYQDKEHVIDLTKKCQPVMTIDIILLKSPFTKKIGELK